MVAVEVTVEDCRAVLAVVEQSNERLFRNERVAA